jgi:sorting nexin-8
LTTGEILEQVVHADRILAKEWQERQKENVQSNSRGSKNELKLDLVRNIVFMGMGEPLDNYTNVVEACRALIDRKRWNLAHGRVTVSTVGLVKQIRRLTEELPEISLALSLHAPNQEMRSAIVPTAKNFYINDLIDALDGHMMAYLKKRHPAGTVFSAEQRIQESSRRRAMIEYVMLEGDTSSLECAHQLGKLCENRHLVVNLIPYNQTDVKDKLRCPSPEHIETFRRIVSSYGAFCTVRRTMGADIDSACGQLITLEGSEKGKVRDIEDTVNQKTGSLRRESANSSKIRRSPVRQLIEPRVHEVVAKEFDWDPWVGHLFAATGIAASCFFVSTYLLSRNRNK